MLLERHRISDTLEKCLLELLKNKDTLSTDYEQKLLDTIELCLRTECTHLLKQHEKELKHILYSCLLDWGVSNGYYILRALHTSNKLSDTVSVLWFVAIKHFNLTTEEYERLLS